VRRWLLPALAVVVWLVIGAVAGPYAGKLSDVTENDDAAFLPANAESTEVSVLEERFETRATTPLIVVWESDQRLSPDAVAQASEQLDRVRQIQDVVDPASPPIPPRTGRR
jgi:RND superfamily putative drug exporter